MCGYNIYLQYVTNTYEIQIDTNNNLINKLLLRDSITSSVININETDSTLSLILLRNKETGKIMTYSDLDSVCQEYEHKIQIQDEIILNAKKYYKFNYSYKEFGDTLILKFWNKK